MDIDQKNELFLYLDTSVQAIARRLRAARMTSGLSQKDFAESVGLKKTTYNSQEVKGAPSPAVLNYLYRNHRIGPNFIYLGEFLPLPGDVRIALEASLREIDLGAATGRAAG